MDFSWLNVCSIWSFSVLAVTILLYVLHRKLTSPNLPPSPPGYPLIGNFFDLAPGQTNAKFTDLARKLGTEVMTLKMPHKNIVILNTYNAIREAFIKQSTAFAGRPAVTIFSYVNPNNYGIFFEQYDDQWRIEKKFMMKAVRLFGYGTPQSELKITREVEKFVGFLESNEGKSVDISEPVCLYMLNYTLSILFNTKHEIDDEKFKITLQAFMDFLGAVFALQEVEPFLWVLKYIPNNYIKRALETTATVKNYVDAHIEEHARTLDLDNHRDFIDACLAEKLSENGILQHFNNDRLSWMIINFLGDAIDTPPNMLKWMFLAMINAPECQKKVHEEIDRVIGDSRMPTLADKSRLPYTEAVMLEMLRMDTELNYFAPRATTEDANLFGYTIPKGTMVVPNTYAVHYDPDIWGDPTVFRPERFIDETGVVVKHEALIPFSLGRRVCLAELFVQKQLFLFFAITMQKFSLQMEPGCEVPGIHPTFLSLRPQPFNVVVTKR